jgi:hypothetical protein
MKIYLTDNLYELEGWGKGEARKYRTECIWHFTSTILRKTREENEEYAVLHSKILQKNYNSRNYPLLSNKLEKAEVVEVKKNEKGTHSYQVGKKSKQFRLINKFNEGKITHVIPISDRMLQASIKSYEEMAKTYGKYQITDLENEKHVEQQIDRILKDDILRLQYDKYRIRKYRHREKVVKELYMVMLIHSDKMKSIKCARD